MIGKHLFQVTIIILFFNVKLFGQEAAVDPYGEQLDIAAAKYKTPGSDCMDYLAEKNREQYKQMKIGDTTVLFMCGEASINAMPEEKDFMTSRTLAFDKAILDGVSKYSEFRAQEISEEISYALKAGKDPSTVNSALEERDKLNDEEKGFFEKFKKLANAKLDKKLKEEGIDEDADKEKALEVINEITESSSFRKSIKTASQMAVSGIQTFKVWESCKSGQQCRVGVLLARTPEQAGIAKALLTKQYGSIKGKPGKPIPKKWKTRDILGQVGARIKRDENGDYHLIAIAIRVPSSQKSTSLDIAYKKARADTAGLIRRFAGAVVTSNTQSITTEIENIDSVGNSDNSVEEYLNSLTTSYSEAAKIEGITTIAQGPVVHPVNPNLPGVYVIQKWSFASQSEARKPLEAKSPSGSVNNDIDSPASTSDTSLESEEADF